MCSIPSPSCASYPFALHVHRFCRDSLLYKGSEDDDELGSEVTGCVWNKRTRTKTMMTATRMRVKGSMVAVRLGPWGVDKRTV